MRRDERGSALVETTWLGLLLLVPLLWIVVSVFEVQRGAYAVSSAARAAGRAFALADTGVQGQARADAAAAQALAGQGLAEAPVEVDVACRPLPRHCHSGGSVITVTVRSSVDLPLLGLFGLGEPRFALETSHTVPVGQYQPTGAVAERSP